MSINYGSHNVSTSGEISAQYLLSSNSSGSEGGELKLAKPASGSSISGASVNIDIFNNTLRIFEQASPNRGYNINITEGSTSAGTSLRTKTLTYFTALNNQPPEVSFATLDTRNNIAILDFSDTSNEYAIFLGCMPDSAVLDSGIVVRILWTATSATSGNCRWGVRFEKMNSDTDYSDNFDYNTEANSAADATNGTPSIATLTCTNIDSLSAGDFFRIQIYRDAADSGEDTMTGDAELIAVELRSVI